MSRLIISGACGRMGRMIAQEAGNASLQVVAGVDRCGEAYGAFPLFTGFEGLPKADVLIDFSSPGNLPAVLAYALKAKLPCVLGTTGYGEDEMKQVEKAAEALPLFQSSNMSLGVYVLRQLAREAARMLPGFDIEIVEKHHNQKADSPSGTALSLLTAVSAPDTLPVFGREGKTCKREPAEIGVHAIRGGTVAGDHEVGFYGNHEVLTLSHSAQSRLIFALGALKAAGFIITQPPGLYGMEDLLK